MVTDCIAYEDGVVSVDDFCEDNVRYTVVNCYNYYMFWKVTKNSKKEITIEGGGGSRSNSKKNGKSSQKCTILVLM